MKRFLLVLAVWWPFLLTFIVFLTIGIAIALASE